MVSTLLQIGPEIGSESGFWGLIGAWPLGLQIIVVLVFGLAAFGGFKGIKQLIKIFKGETKSSRQRYVMTKSDLVNHPIFGQLEHFLSHEIRMLDFGDKDRDKIFRMILTTQFREYNNQLYQLVTNDENIDKLTTAELRTKVYKNFNSIIGGYNGKLKEGLGRTLHGLIMDDNHRGYNVWHEPVLQMISSSMDDILNDEDKYNNYERLHDILNRYKNSLKSVKMNVENTFRNFNGELDNVLNCNKK